MGKLFLMKELCTAWLVFIVFLAGCSTPTVKADDSENDDSVQEDVATFFSSGNGSVDDPYVIKTAEQLVLMAKNVNGVDYRKFGKSHYKLDADIELNDGLIIDENGNLVADTARLLRWNSIGKDSLHVFHGSFDGDGHTIRGIFLSDTSSFRGLFGHVDGVLQNFILENGWVACHWSCGGAAGAVYGSAKIKNVQNKMSVTADDYGAGGIVGTRGRVNENDGSELIAQIESCSNSGKIKNEKYYAGGICGYVYGVDLKNVRNEGQVEGYSRVGGIAGAVAYSSSVSRAINEGKILADNYAGGILGDLTYRSLEEGNFRIENCVNYGSVSGNHYPGGVVGYSSLGTIKSVSNFGNVESDEIAGGVVGKCESCIVSSAYSTGKVSKGGLAIGHCSYLKSSDQIAQYSIYYLSQDSQEGIYDYDSKCSGSLTPKTELEMKSKEFAEILGDDFVYDPKLNDGYPSLKWLKEL